ncbi:MAG: hypothetical protein HY360_02650 [Verrucomicrobia bacterium]|nr:hypothetical protein [Verrucomicrobiota bacterium]
MKALALRREDRYQTTPELQKDIEAYQGGFATSAEGAGMLRQMVLLLKRHKTETALEKGGWWTLLEKEKRELKHDEKGLLELDLHDLPISDLKPLKGMPLAKLNLFKTKISDLSPLKGMSLTTLHIDGCLNIKDLGPVKGMPVVGLNLQGCTGIKDLTPLADCKELQILVIPVQCKGKAIECLRNLPNLKQLDYEWKGGNTLTVEEFWKKHGIGGKK